MKGDVGPYVDPDGPTVWVPRTVPYLEARTIALQAVQDYGERIRYTGKVEDAVLIGFVRDCQCDDVCGRRWRNDQDTGNRDCEVPAWRFEVIG